MSKPEVPNPLENKGVETPAVKTTAGVPVHVTPAYIAEERNRVFKLADGVTMREDR